MIGTIKNYKRYLIIDTGIISKKENTKLEINAINDKKPIIVKDLIQNFISNSKTKDQNSSINLYEEP